MIELLNVSHTFQNGCTSLKDINLKLNKGEFIVLTGENGSGKTVLSLLLNGLYTPSKGKILYNGVNLEKHIPNIRTKVGIVFQDSDTQIVGQTVYDDIAFGLENLRHNRNSIDKIVTENLKLVGLESYNERVPTQLSGGEKKRLAIAGILAMQPEYIILDEPFNGLDLPGIKQILEQLIKLHDMGKSILVITHDLEKVLAHANRLIVLKQGQLVKIIDLQKETSIKHLSDFNIKIPKCKISEMTWLK